MRVYEKPPALLASFWGFMAFRELLLAPNLLAGVKQWDQFAGCGVHGIETIRLAPIAVKTGQGQIFER